MTERLHFHFSLSCTGEGNGNPLQCSCLENPRAGGAWWAAVCGVAQNQTRLKRLSSNSSSIAILGKGNGNPIQYSCLEKTRDGGAWWAAIYGVARSRTRLKRLSSSGWSPARGFAHIAGIGASSQCLCYSYGLLHQFSSVSVQSLSRVQLFVTP